MVSWYKIIVSFTSSVCDRINKLFRVQVFWKFTSASIVICCTGFVTIVTLIKNASTYPLLYFLYTFILQIAEDPLIIIQFVIFLTMILAQTYQLSVYGDVLVHKSTLVGEMAYDSEWYLCDQTEKKFIKLIIMRAQKPCYISIYRFGSANRQVFEQVCQ